MEPLLSLSFANISSRDASKIRKGLRQIEGLLAQICLSAPSKSSSKRRASIVPESQTPCKGLVELCDDPAFCEFYRLQEGFEWNVTTHLITCLERLLSMPPNSANDTLLLSAMNLLQGMLILHPPSRALFAREIYMNLLLDLLPPSFPPALQAATLVVLVITLVDNPQNARIFEQVDGLLAVSALLKEPDTTRSVRQKVLELLYLYLLPERDANSQPGTYSTDTARRIPSASAYGSGRSAGEASIIEDEDRYTLRTGREKQNLLGKYYGDVHELREEFETVDLFDGVLG